MESKSGYISVGKERLHYLEWGSGRKLLLAFHGYGDDASLFSPLAQFLGHDYTILSFDLPHHGKSEWPDDLLLSRKDVSSFVVALKAKYHADKVSLLGYSMGGRVCLSIVEDLPEDIDRVALIATDGLSVNLYYYFFTQTYPGKKMFRHMLKKPGPYFKVMERLKNWQMVDHSKYKFVMYFLHSEESRKLLLRVWPAMSDLMPRPKKVKSLIKQYAMPVSIFMGKYDKIMPPSLAEKFKSGIASVQLFTLEKGHRVFDADNARQVADRFL